MVCTRLGWFSTSFAALYLLKGTKWSFRECRTTRLGSYLSRLHWLPVKQRIIYKTAVLTLKVQTSATPSYLSCHLQTRHSVRHLRSSGTSLLSQPSTRTAFAACGFRHSAPAVWDSLSKTVLDRPSLTVSKSQLKTHLSQLAYNDEH